MLEVQRESRGPQIILSRTHPDFLLPAGISEWGPNLGSKGLAKGTGITQTLTVPADLPPGTYKILLGIINERTGLPINLDVDITPFNGLYPLGDLVVTAP